MKKLGMYVQAFLGHEAAATTVEYAVMLALIIIVAIVGIRNFGTQTSSVWSNNLSEIETATSGS